MEYFIGWSMWWIDPMHYLYSRASFVSRISVLSMSWFLSELEFRLILNSYLMVKTLMFMIKKESYTYFFKFHEIITVLQKMCEFSFGFMTPLFSPCPVLEQTMEESANQRRRNTCWLVFTWTRLFTQNFYCFNNTHLHIFAWKYDFLTHILPLKREFIVLLGLCFLPKILICTPCIIIRVFSMPNITPRVFFNAW